MTFQPPALQAALRYAERGWHVLPLTGIRAGQCTCHEPTCRTPGKHPITPDGVLDATVDADLIRTWFLRHPLANLGIAAGPSKLAIADVDPRKGGLESLASLGVDTRNAGKVRTGDGWHLYYSDPEGKIRSGNGRLGRGLDVKAAGGYVVAPPSLHAYGSLYLWERLPGNLPPWPFKEQPASMAIGSRLPEGMRNDRLTSLAGTLHYREFPANVIHLVIETVNDAICDPPLDPAEVHRIVENITRRPHSGHGLAAILERRAGAAPKQSATTVP